MSSYFKHIFMSLFFTSVGLKGQFAGCFFYFFHDEEPKDGDVVQTKDPFWDHFGSEEFI